MSELNLALVIETVGAKEAYESLNLLDKKGRQVVDDAAGAMGRAMGDVASAYTRGSEKVRASLEQIAQGHRNTIAEIESQGAATDRLQRRQGMAGLAATRGLEQIARSGKTASSALDTVLSQVSQIAFGFGKAGPIVGAIAIATIAVVDMMRKAAAESKKLADDVAKDFERIAHLDVKGQGEARSLLFSGDPNGTGVGAFSLNELKRQRADFQAQTEKGTRLNREGLATMTPAAMAAADALAKVNVELDRRNKLLLSSSVSIVNAGKQQAAADLPGFITDQIKAAEEAGKEAARRYKKAWDKAVKEFAKGVDERGNAIQKKAQGIAAEMIEMDDMMKVAMGIPTKEQITEAVREAARNIADAIENDPFLKHMEAVKKLAKRMQDEISQTLGAGLAAGFEEAFNADGFQNPFAAFASVVLNGLGSFMIQLGSQMVLIGLALDGLASALLSLNGPGAIAAGVALIAAGAGLRAVASSFGKTPASAAGSGSAISSAPTFLTFGVQASAPPTTSMPAPQSRSSFGPNYFIGPEDPKVQRQFAEIVNRADARGLVNR